MQWIDSYQLFLFDFDGLLVNTEHLHFEAYKEMCRNRGYQLEWDYYRYCEIAHVSVTSLKDAAYATFPDLYIQEPKWEVLYEEKKQAYERLIKSGSLQLMPGVEELLKNLEAANVKRCVVTNSTKPQIDIVKESLPILHSIPHWFTRERYVRAKPAPDGYLTALKQLRVEGERTIGFEDTLKGLKSLWDAKVDQCVLICSHDHPQLKVIEGIEFDHFNSFNNAPA